MITIIGNLKGGTGKSTVAFNLGIWLAYEKDQVKGFDLDPQCTLADVCEVREEDGYDPLLEVSSDINELIALADDKTSQVIVDVSASNMAEMEKAIGLADQIVIPIQPSQADIWSTQRFLKIINGHKRADTKVLGFINRADTHVGVRETDEAEDALNMLQNIQPINVRLHQRTAFRRSFSEGLAVFELDPMGKAAKETRQLASLIFE